MSICFGIHRPLLVRPPKLAKLSGSCKSGVSIHFEEASRWNPSSISHFKAPVRRLGSFRVASVASSPPLDGSSAEYLGQLEELMPKQKTDRILGKDKDEIEDPSLLADTDSCFCEFNGVQLHHKICDAELPGPAILNEGYESASSDSSKRVKTPIILLHGFGASVFSWNKVLKPLAQTTGSKVLAFDRPGFGLTSRVNAVQSQDSRHLNPYSKIFSVLASLFFIDFLAAEKAVLVGLPDTLPVL